jgi:hypothetical protein
MSKLTDRTANRAESRAGAAVAQRRAPNQPSHFRRGVPPTTTGRLLLEVALFAAENMAFTQQSDAGAADRARDHLLQIRELVGRRLAELPSPQDDARADSL